MTQPFRIKSITELHRLIGLPTPSHPLISVIDLKKPETDPGITSVILDFYSIALKRGCDKLIYGQQKYDFDEGLMSFMAPGQIIREGENADTHELSGWMLFIHPDFLWNTHLAKKIKHYEFFSYSTNEALFLSEKEENTINGVIENIRSEYNANIDKFSQEVIVAHLEVLLTYAQRFYERQFITRKFSNSKILEKVETILEKYFEENNRQEGLPAVKPIADQLNLSAKYLSSLLKQLTGQTAQQIIHEKLIEKAKEKLSTTDLSVSEIAFDLGFEHSQSFSKLFKTKTKQSPLEFRASFN